MENISQVIFKSDFKITEFRVLAEVGSASPIFGKWNGEWVNFPANSFKFDENVVEKLELYAYLHNELFHSLEGDDICCDTTVADVQLLGDLCQSEVAIWLLINGIEIKLEKRDDFINIEGLTGTVDEYWHDNSVEEPPRGGAYWCFLGGEDRSAVQQRTQTYSKKWGWNDDHVTHWRYLPLNPDKTSIADWSK